MVFQKVESKPRNFWNPKKVDDSITWNLKEVKLGVGPFKQTHYILTTAEGEMVVNGHKIIDEQMQNMAVGDKIKIIFKGKKKNYYLFEVYKDDGQSVPVETPAQAEVPAPQPTAPAVQVEQQTPIV